MYVNFISGETSAGKSSMLNLILGEELLPFSVLSTTSTICELKYGKERQIKIHYKEAGKEPKIKYLDESSSYTDQISEFVHVKSPTLREKASDYSKVELFWPQKLLQVRKKAQFFRICITVSSQVVCSSIRNVTVRAKWRIE